MKCLGNHNRCWIWGRHVVLETLRAATWPPLEVLYSARCPAEVVRELVRHCTVANIDCREVSDPDLTGKCRSDEHQGVAAQMPDFSYALLDDLLAAEPSTAPCGWLILDGIQDSFNFGAMIRSAVELQMTAILIGTVGQSPVNSQVARSSSGGVNHLPIARIDPLVAGVAKLKGAGVRVIAASEKGTASVSEVDLTGRVALVVGNEGRGVSAAVWDQCDVQVRIPTTGIVGSLNAAVAAGIVCYERLRQLQKGAV
jgi:23S rRNA (guanosine2251-2'-O)-methyltransferase